jgi:hypothetical protein
MLFHVISMIFLWDFCGIPVGFPWYFYDIFFGTTIGFLWDADGISMGFLWGFKRMSMGVSLDSYGISMMFP